MDSSNPNFCRPLIIQMTDEKAVSYWTEQGRGHKTDYKLECGDFIYINPDLCNADRKARFLARQEGKRRRAEAQKKDEGREKQPAATNRQIL